MDDLLIKSCYLAGLIGDLREVFDILRKNLMILNPKKCIFGVFSGKFLRFMVSKSKIKPNPDKVQAIRDMKPLKMVCNVQRFTGQIAALNQFLSWSTV